MVEFLADLKRRKLVQWALAYLAAAWAVLQALGLAADSYGWPRHILQIGFAATALGFVITLLLAWYHGERGAQRVSGTELLLIALVLAVGGGLLWRFAREAPAATGTVAARGTDGVQGNPPTVAPDAKAAPSASRAVSSSVQAPPIPGKSVAVLPFVNMSGDPKNDYFSDGITEEILNALAQVPNLKVAARTSAFAFKGKEEDLRKVGEVLDVATVLEGSVQRSGDEVRITAQLIDTRTGYHLWSEKYDRKLTSIFAVEDEISKAIADKLRVQLVGGNGQPLIRHATEDPRAHALYLQGIAEIARRGPALKDAAVLLQQATARDPGYADAWAGLSQVQELLPWYELADWPDSLDAAERSAERALALDPQSGEAHAALANVLRDRLEFAAAESEYRKALALSPGSSEIHNQFAQLLNAVGASEATLRQERIAVSLDPLAPNPRYMLGFELVSQHRYPEAATAFEKILEQTPDYAYARFHLALTHLYEGHDEEALKIGRAAALQAGQDPATIEMLLRAGSDPALRPEALKRIAGVDRIQLAKLDDLAKAFWYSQLGARELALASLQRWAIDAPLGERFNGMRWLRLPTFDPIRDDPRFKAVLAKLGLPYRVDTAETK
ncbi:MAG TPA: tetratricopeptide repeat protein [Rhodanobacteraceae bacterium]|nr:tetratricopeptide repeat protein [Rhodanobacteraceae bacterium]